MMHKTSIALIVVVFMLGLGAILWLTRPKIPQALPKQETQTETKRWEHPDIPSEGYLGSESCRKCHADLYESYQTHAMAHAADTVQLAVPLEDYTHASFAPIGRQQYRVEKTEDAILHHEFQESVDGELIYDQAVPVDYAVGSGKRGRSYITDRDGLFFMSPITWYSERDCWDLSPGYLPGQHQRFERRIPDGCIVCHSGRMNFDRDQPHHYANPPFQEKTIGCENCHGPGQEHVAFHQLAHSTGNDPIVNPADLKPAQREAVCNQCHLQGENRILRYKTSEHDFRPGMSLEDIWVVFVQGHRASGSESTKAVSHVEQMRSSRCYIESLGEMGCHSCHDPHSYPSPDNKQNFFQSRCLKCHTDQSCSKPLTDRIDSSFGNSCVACHMPKLAASDVPHTTQTDHRILRIPTAQDQADTMSKLALFGDAEKTLTQLQIDRAWGLHLITDANGKTAAYQVISRLTPVLKVAPDDVDVLLAMASAHKLLDENHQSRKYLEEALKQDPRNERALQSLAILLHNQGNIQLARKYLERYLAINPWNAGLQGRLAHVLGQLGEHDAAIQAAEKSLELNPSMYQVHGWLSETYKKMGKPEQARQHRELFEKVKPLKEVQ